jgi:WD40 repeat protein
VFLYDGATGDKVADGAAQNGHTGGIFSLSWSPDSRQFMTSSADMTVKIWDVETRQAVTYAFITALTFQNGVVFRQR